MPDFFSFLISNPLIRLAEQSHYESGPLNTPCLVWEGYTTSAGYGQISFRGKKERTHRVAWIGRHGPIPVETPHVLHRCDNPPCWRDDHLFLGTNADNVADMVSKGRARGRR